MISRLHASPATGPDSPTGTQQWAEDSAIERLASLVEDVASRLETPAGLLSAGELVPECNAELEACLEFLRDVDDRDDLVRTAIDDLHRLGRILKVVENADVPFVMRQIRRVLGRFDTCGGSLTEERRG